jgi:hypothetical protein
MLQTLITSNTWKVFYKLKMPLSKSNYFCIFEPDNLITTKVLPLCGVLVGKIAIHNKDQSL